jgi:hypothetical protein
MIDSKVFYKDDDCIFHELIDLNEWREEVKGFYMPPNNPFMDGQELFHKWEINHFKPTLEDQNKLNSLGNKFVRLMQAGGRIERENSLVLVGGLKTLIVFGRTTNYDGDLTVRVFEKCDLPAEAIKDSDFRLYYVPKKRRNG